MVELFLWVYEDGHLICWSERRIDRELCLDCQSQMNMFCYGMIEFSYRYVSQSRFETHQKKAVCIDLDMV